MTAAFGPYGSITNYKVLYDDHSHYELTVVRPIDFTPFTHSSRALDSVVNGKVCGAAAEPRVHYLAVVMISASPLSPGTIDHVSHHSRSTTWLQATRGASAKQAVWLQPFAFGRIVYGGSPSCNAAIQFAPSCTLLASLCSRGSGTTRMVPALISTACRPARSDQVRSDLQDLARYHGRDRTRTMSKGRGVPDERSDFASPDVTSRSCLSPGHSQEMHHFLFASSTSSMHPGAGETTQNSAPDASMCVICFRHWDQGW